MYSFVICCLLAVKFMGEGFQSNLFFKILTGNVEFIYNIDHGVDDDDGDTIQPRRKVLFKDLIELPKRDRSKAPRKKVFTFHYLPSSENQEIIRKAEKTAKRKELAKAKTEAYKRFLEEEKQKKKDIIRKKKVTVRSDKVQVRSLLHGPYSLFEHGP